MKRFLPYFALLKPVRGQFLLALIFGVVHGIASGFGLPFATEKVFPTLFSATDPPLWALVASVAILPAAFIVRGVAGYLNTYLLTYCGMRVLRAIQLQLYRKIQSLPLEFFHATTGGDLLNRVMGDTAILQQTLTVTANSVIKQPVTLLGAIGALVYLSFKHHELFFILICVALIPVLALPIRYAGRKISEKVAEVQSKAGTVYNVVQENLIGKAEVRLFNLQDSQVERFRKTVTVFQRLQLEITKYTVLVAPSVEFLSTIGVAMAIFYAARTGVSLENIIPLIVALFVSYQPLKGIGALHTQLKRSLISLDRLESVLNQEDTLPDPERPVPLPSARGEIEFRDVSFGYGENLVLRNIDQTVVAGQIVALVGPSGAGKTSFASLIPRLYDVTSGQLLIDGTDVRSYTKRELRAQISTVPQDPVLFNDTIRRNILVGREGASEDDVIRAAQRAYAHEFIKSLPLGYKTIVGERGTCLSGGQRQRIAIARAFLKNAPILILDEATSNLDSQSEAMIQQALTALVRGRTTLIIAHRFSTLKVAERILVFEDGKIVASGTSEELLSRSERYRALYELQPDGHPSAKR